MNSKLILKIDSNFVFANYGVEFIPGLMVVNGEGTVIYQREWTELEAGTTVDQQWDSEVRQALDKELGLL